MPKPEMIKKFWDFQKISDAVTEVMIYDYIAMYNTTDWWTGEKSEEVTPKAFKAELDAVSTPEICVRINSGGGDIFAAVSISTMIHECRESGKKVTCKIDGFCASAAVQIALSCEKISIPSSAYIMIHNPMTILWGYYQAPKLTPIMDSLNKMRDGILNAYTERTGLSEEEIIKMMDAESWMTGKEAVEKGFADELMFTQVKTEVVEDEENDMKNFFINGARFDFAAYHKTPKALQDAFYKNTSKKKTKGEGETMEFKNSAELKAAFPEFVNEMEAEAKKAGVEAERERLKAIDAMQGKVSDEVLNKAKYETFEDAKTVALNAVTNGEFVNGTVLNGMQEDAEDANGVGGFANTGAGTSNLTEKQAQAKFAGDVAAKAFGTNKK